MGSWRAGAFALAVAAVVAAVAVVVPAVAATRQDGSAYTAKPVDPYPKRAVPTTCNGASRAGLIKFKDMILAEVGGGDSGVYSCRPIEGKQTLSYHADSRAWDWRMNAKRASDRDRVNLVLSWLLRTDARGVPHANARRLGIGEIIWNREIVTLWSDHPAPPCHHDPDRMSCFRPYDGVNPHTDHVHFSFSVPGAEATTVWARSRTATPSWHLTNLPVAPADPLAPFGFGFGDGIPLSGDWDGDGDDTLGIYDPRDRRFYLRNSATSGPFDIATAVIGPFGAIPFVGDWNGDRVDEFGVYIPTTRRFVFVDRSGNELRPSLVFGALDDTPLIGNWDGGDLDDEIGVYRPAYRMFYRRLDQAGSLTDIMGRSGDIPLAGDFDRNGGEDVGVFRPSNHTFYLRTATGTELVPYGNSSATPVVGDWDGNGEASPGVAMPVAGTLVR